MANKKLRFVALIAVVLMLVCMLVACTTTATSSVSYKVTIHSDGQSDIVWDRQTDFPTLSKEHHTVAGLYLDAEYKTAVTPEDLVNMFLTGDIDVYVKYDRIHYSITVHPLNGGSDVIWQNAPGNKIPEFKKVGYVMSGFYFDENCTQQADSVFTEDILENKEVWVKWVECDHKALAPTDWTTDKQATCTEDGLKVATCPTCDKTFEDTIDTLGHNQDGSVAHKDANCTETGVVGGTYCTRCDDGRAEAETIIPVDSTKHTFGEWIPEVPATCTTLGTKGHKDCTDCKKSFTANNVEIADLTIAIDKNNHDIEHHTAKAPTCTEIGWDAYDTCKRVGCEYTTYNQLNATGHKYGNVVYDWADDHSTCTAKHVCENGTCEHEETATATVTSHKTQEATCQQVELTKYTATFTASWATTQIVENVQTAKKADHNYSEDWTIDKVATCTVDGSKSHHCLTEGCESKSNETTIVANHTFGEWIEKVPATCETDGTNGHYHCSVCEANFDAQYKELESITISATGHTTTKICTDKDGHWYACVNDGCTYTTQKVDHTWNKGEQTKDPTETEEGEKTYTCTLCWQTKKEYTGKLDHVHTFDTAIWNNDGEYHWHPAACGHSDEKDGYEEHAYGDVTYTWSSDNTTCTAVHSCKCGYSESEKATITTSVTPATCTTAKYTTYTATFTASWATTQIVENVQTDEALGHNQDGSVAHKDANCTETGVVGGTYCTRCDDGKAKAETIIPVDPTKHTFGEWILEVPATCTSTGTKGHKDCSVCGKHFDNEGNEIADLTIAIGTNNHDIEDHPAKEATCTEPGWDAYVTCKREGCEYTTKVEIPAKGHTYGEWHDEVPADCVNAGAKGYKDCSVCKKHFDNDGNVITDLTITAKGHTYGDWQDEKPATYWETGTKGYKYCSVCEKNYDKDGKEVESLTIEQKPATSYNDYITACENSDKVAILGYISCISTNKKNVWVVDAEGHGYYVYNLSKATTLEVGAEVAVEATATTYNGLYELKDCTIIASGKTATDNGVTIGTYQDLTDVFTNGDTKVLNGYQNTFAELKGVTIAGVEGDKLSFELGEKTYVLYVESSKYIIDSTTASALKALWDEGQTADIKGIVSVFNSFQIIPVDANAITLSDSAKLATITGIPTEVSADFTLPSTAGGSNITWTSIDSAIAIGTLTDGAYPAIVTQGTDDVTVTLTAKLNDATKTFEVTVKKQGEVVSKNKTETITYTGTTTIQMSDSSNNATTVGIDASIFYVQSRKNSGSTQVGLNKAGFIRLHKNSASVLTVYLNTTGYEIVQIEVDFSTSKGTLVVEDGNEKQITGTSTDTGICYIINGQKFVMYNSNSTTTSDITKIIITYKETGTLTDQDKLDNLPLIGEADPDNEEQGIIAVGTDTWDLNEIAAWTVVSGGEYVSITGYEATFTHGEADQRVVLKATLGDAERDFTIIVRRALTDSEKLEKITAPKGEAIADFTLDPNAVWSVPEGTTAVELTGNSVKVNRGTTDVTVTFTATVGTASKTFDVVIKAQSTATWTKATSISVGDVITITNEEAKKMLGAYTNKKYFALVDSFETATQLTVVQGSVEGSFAFKTTINGYDYYLSVPSSGKDNYLYATATEVSDITSWKVEINEGVATITNVEKTTRIISYNESATRFSSYTNVQADVYIYKKG